MIKVVLLLVSRNLMFAKSGRSSVCPRSTEDQRRLNLWIQDWVARWWAWWWGPFCSTRFWQEPDPRPGNHQVLWQSRCFHPGATTTRSFWRPCGRHLGPWACTWRLHVCASAKLSVPLVSLFNPKKGPSSLQHPKPILSPEPKRTPRV